MSRLEELIQQLCPDGVEYKELGAVSSISRGGSFQKKDFVQTGFPCIHYGQIYTKYNLFVKNAISYITADVAEKQKRAVTGDIVMAVTSENIEDVCRCVAWLGDGEIAVSGHAAIIHHTLEPKYLVYYLSSSLFFQQKLKLVQGTKVIEVSPEKLKRVKIPIPPLEVQQEIVRILDQFTELTAELTAELTSRKKQYAYYRDKLLTFTDEVPLATLGDVALVTKLAGFEFTKYVRYSDSGNMIALRGLNVKNGKLDLTDVKYIDNSDFSKLTRSKLHIGDMLFTYVGTIGQVALIDEEDKFYLAPNVALIRSVDDKLSPQYMRYYFQSSNFWKTQINKLMQSSSMQNIPMEKIRKFTIPLPPLDEQHRIVSILDRFDTLSNDLTSGLPAEIEARQKQYEYYRDKLLAFPELREQR